MHLLELGSSQLAESASAAIGMLLQHSQITATMPAIIQLKTVLPLEHKTTRLSYAVFLEGLLHLREIPQGLKPRLFPALFGTTEQLAEKGRGRVQTHEEHPAGAEAHVDFSDTCGTTKVMPCYKTLNYSQRNELFRSL